MNCPTAKREVPLINTPSSNKISVRFLAFLDRIKKKHKMAKATIKTATTILRYRKASILYLKIKNNKKTASNA